MRIKDYAVVSMDDFIVSLDFREIIEKVKEKFALIFESKIVRFRENVWRVFKVIEKPKWLKEKLNADRSKVSDIKIMLRSLRLHTVCEEARCPNVGECFASRTATFMILGNVCTRRCRFCAVSKEYPALPIQRT
jgi:lipoate synthase